MQLIAEAEVPLHEVHPVGQATQVLAMLTNPVAQEKQVARLEQVLHPFIQAEQTAGVAELFQ